MPRVKCPDCGIPTIEDASHLRFDDMLCERCHKQREYSADVAERRTLKDFTIVGTWYDNQQPFVAFVTAETVDKAYQALKRKLLEGMQNGEEVPAPEGVWIIGAFEGHLMEIGGLHTQTLLSDIEDT